MSKRKTRIATAICLAVIVWVLASFIEVGLHNCDGVYGNPYTYSAWNLFTILEGVW